MRPKNARCSLFLFFVCALAVAQQNPVPFQASLGQELIGYRYCVIDKGFMSKSSLSFLSNI